MEPWTFAFATDIHVGTPRSFRFAPAWNDNWATARRQIAALGPDLLLLGGDLTRDGALAEHRYELENIKTDLDALPFPYHVTPGNMDTGNKHTRVQRPFTDRRDDLALNLTPAQLAQFEAVFGPHAWSFVHKNVRFSSFCTMLLGSGLPEEAKLWDWLEEQPHQPRAPHHVWLTHCAIFIDNPKESNFDATDPTGYHSWYFGLDEPQRSRLIEIFKATGATCVLSGHIHCRKTHQAHGIRFDIGPSTAFAQWAGRWPDGDPTLGFMRYDVTDETVSPHLVPLEHISTRKGYGPGGHPLPEQRDYSIAWETE